MDENGVWDVIVIGGGPAGMMAAGTAAKNGAQVLLVEKNDTLGKKLLLTGGGRCNVTNAELDTRKFLEKFKSDGKFLFSSFSQYGVKETLDFFHKNGMKTKIEAGLRVFPLSESSRSVLDVLIKCMHAYKVTVHSNSPVAEIIVEDGVISGVRLKNKKIVRGRAVILATGGTSHPDTGSTGDGFRWLKKIGHTVIEPKPSLVPIALKDAWVKNLSGISVSDIKLTVFLDGKKQDVVKGKILFTHVGITGPTVLNMSKRIGEFLRYGEIIISLDLLPKEDHGTLNTKLQELFRTHDKKKIRNALPDLIPSAIVPLILTEANIDPEIQCNSITREARMELIKVLKGIPLHVDRLLGVDKAIITSGGVVLNEVDFKTMQSRLFSNLYFAGDILNIDRPSGGFSLQLCWTTGFVAGTHSSKM